MQRPDPFPSGSYAELTADDIGRPDERAPLVMLHGLTFDRRMWRAALAALETIDPGRRVIALDLPGHGESPDASSYSLRTIVDRVHAAVTDADLRDPVVVGHSGSAATAAVYASQHSTRGVIDVEGSFDVPGFAGMVRSMEPFLRGPGFADTWARIAANVFRLDEVTPDVRDFVQATSRPRQEVVLGYWQDLFEVEPVQLQALLIGGTAAVRASGVPYTLVRGHDPSSDEVAFLRANLPDATVEVWPQSGHFPPLAHPRRFAELLAASGTWAGQGAPTRTAH
jgi:pimeloyl-ACP methyl ester carboxylesterase